MSRSYILRLLLFAALGVLSACGLFAQVPGPVLLVVAHPDDEYYFSATAYRIAAELGGIVDELVITNGEAGFKYSTFANKVYGKNLTLEAVGRKELPAIRRQEALNAGRVLGLRDHYFLDQKDQGLTTDSNEGLKQLWNVDFVVSTIADLIKGKHYQYVFTILPRATTHGHHQAATILATQAIRSLPQEIRPTLLGFDTNPADYVATQSPDTKEWPKEHSFKFDREQPLGFRDALNYQVVVDWMIAEHKSQGLLQTTMNKDRNEFAWVDEASCPAALVNAQSLFRELSSDIAKK